jgi:hypothetical protein
MRCEITDAWFQGYIQVVFDSLGREDWLKAEKLARKSWRKKCENLTLIGRPQVVDLPGLFNAFNAGVPA